MSKRFWLLGIGVLISVAILVACGSNYNSVSDGLVLVGSQGSGLIETFSFSLNNGAVAAIANSPNDTANLTCVLNGLPSSIVIDPAGVYAYVILNQNSTCAGSATGIAAFKINSSGTLTQVGTLLSDPNPVNLAMDSAGKFLFVAEGLSSTAIANSTSNSTSCVQTAAQYGVCVYAIGSGASLTAVAPTFTAPPTPLPPNFAAVVPSPTVFPAIGVNGVQNAVCSTPGTSPPTSEFLYAIDSTNYTVWEFSVNTTTGALGNPTGTSVVQTIATDNVPAGIAVDPCDRFLYVSDNLANKVSAYTICTQVLPANNQCPLANGTLNAVAGSPFSLSGSANGPGPLVVDPYGNNVYVVGMLSNTVSPLKISPTSGALSPLNPATVATGIQPTSIAIRGDDNWLFVSNIAGIPPSVSQYSVSPATGALTAEPVIQTDNEPFGVAVK